MQLADPTPTKFLYKGVRARPGEVVGSDEQGEIVGVFIMKQTIEMDGTVVAVDEGGQPILLADATYPLIDPTKPESNWFPTLIKLESDLAATKPLLDLVVVNSLAQLGVTQPIPPDPVVIPNPDQFGTVSINQGVGTALDYGWLTRGDGPRLGYAYDPAIWDDVALTFDFTPNGENLPKGFNNMFFNGGLVQPANHLDYGDEVTFTDTSNNDYVVQIPTAPMLTIIQNDLPIELEQPILPKVDTVIFEQTLNQFLLTWRAVFLWENRFELAKLEVT